MFCTNCGAFNNNGAPFCTTCGAELKAEVSPADNGSDNGSDTGKPDKKSFGSFFRSEKSNSESAVSKPELPDDDEETGIEKAYDKVEEAFGRFGTWLSGKPADAGRAVKEKYSSVKSDIKSDKRKQKLLLAVIAGIILLAVIISAGSCICSSCDCYGTTFKGTWVESESAADGYNRGDVIYEFRKDGSVYSNGRRVGVYSHSDGMLTFTPDNGFELSGKASPSDREVTLYLVVNGEISPYASKTFIKLTGRTGLEPDELSGLYPED